MVTGVDRGLLRGLVEKPLERRRTCRSSRRNTVGEMKGGWNRRSVVVAREWNIRGKMTRKTKQIGDDWDSKQRR